jgi:hypothetical protein
VVVVGALVVRVVVGSMVVGVTVTREVTIEVTVTVRTCCCSAPALPMAAPSRNPATASTQPRRHHGGRPPGRGGLGGGGCPQPPGGPCAGGCPHPPWAPGGIGWVGWSDTLAPPQLHSAAAGRLYGKNEPLKAHVRLDCCGVIRWCRPTGVGMASRAL